MKHARPDYDVIQAPHDMIPEEEPVFLIRGQDMVGAEAVRFWAQIAGMAGAETAICLAALEQASRMEKWQRERGSKCPDLPEGAGK